MSRPNYIAFVEHLYRFNPEFRDWQIISMLEAATVKSVNDARHFISKKTLSVFKARLRKKGIEIPDQRKKRKKT